MIAMNDFKADPEELIQAELRALERVVRSGWYVLGNEVTAFEKEWAAACGAPHSVGVGNGMDAIEIGLRALGIGPGHEVITTPMTAFATVLAILRAGATPVLADIREDTALLDPESVRSKISAKTKAVLLVHLYGQVRDMEVWTELCRSEKIFLLEDCAQAHLATWKGTVAGGFGEWGAYSFYPTKNLGAVGDGGALNTRRADVATMAAVLRNYGQEKRYYHSEIGMNSRLDEIQAALLSERLKWLAGFTARRREIARIYFDGIHNPKVLTLAPPVESENHAYHLFVVRCDRRDDLAKHLAAQGVESLIHYPVPMHTQTACAKVFSAGLSLPVADRHAATCLSIPCHHNMTADEAHKVVEAVNAF
jgi:dTDP-4-amino-4,6-dideoxygalactose transaminase